MHCAKDICRQVRHEHRGSAQQEKLAIGTVNLGEKAILPLNGTIFLHLMRKSYGIFDHFYEDKVQLMNFKPFLPWIAYKRKGMSDIPFLCYLSIWSLEIIYELRCGFICEYYMSGVRPPHLT